MAQPKLTAGELIILFEREVNDVTELSSSEELSLLNRVYLKLCNQRPWEFLKAVASGTILSDVNGSYLTMPTDFGYFVQDESFTVIGTSYSPFYVINLAQKRNYLNRNNYAYYDFATGQLRFLGTPTATSYEFNYIKVPALLTLPDYPIFPGQFHEMLTYAMATDNDILQLSPKATSYAAENNAKYASDLRDMEWWNSQFIPINDV